MKPCDAGKEMIKITMKKQPSKGKYLAAHVYRNKTHGMKPKKGGIGWLGHS